MKKVAWVVLVALIVGLGHQLVEKMARDDGTLRVARDGVDGRTVVMTWYGPVEHPLADKVAQAYFENADTADRFVLSLSSPGGSITQGVKAIQVLNRIKRTHQLDTAVEGRRQCASMCVPIFLQGQSRYASPGSRWLFHQVSVRDAISDEEFTITASEKRTLTDRFFDRFFRPAGVPDAWIARIRPHVMRGDVWRSGRQLVAEKSGIVTTLQD